MTGSAVDGEDIVQDAMIKAINALPAVGAIDNPGGWLFRIAHNTALDFLRRPTREPVIQPAVDLSMIAADESAEHGEEIAVTSLRTFLRLPALQRSAVMFDRNVSLDTPAYFVALTFKEERVVAIHDFLFARYALDGVDLMRWEEKFAG